MLSDLIKKVQDNDIHTQFLDELLHSKFDKNKLEKLSKNSDLDINYLNEEDENFLFTCLEQGEIKSALWLISKGIDVAQPNNKGKTPFEVAIENLNHRVVRAILDKHSIDLDRTDSFGRTKLQDAVVLGNHEMAKLLIEHGANINSTDAKGRTVLHDAFSYGNLKFIDYLLNLKELDLNTIDIENNSILHHKLVLENNELAKNLIEHGANPNLRNSKGHTYLSIVAQRGVDSFEIIETAINNGFDINSRVADEKTILMEILSALSNIDPENEVLRKSLLSLSKKLIKIGLDINAVDKNNENALFQAVRNGDPAFVLTLLQEGARVNIQNNTNGESPLFYACYGGEKNIEIISYLFKYNADPLLINKDKRTILEILNLLILSYHGKKEFIDNSIMKYAVGGTKFMNVLKVVLKYTKDQVNFLDSNGQPIFFLPLLYDHVALFKLYIRAGANLDMLSIEGKNLFFEYVLKVFEDENEEVDFEEGLSILISNKVDHNIQDETGWTVFSKVIAQTSCNLVLFKALLKRIKFDLTIVDKLGRTVLHSAIWKGNMDILRIINTLDKDIRNVPDYYGILPSIYAALLGNKELILYFVDIKAKLGTKKPISQAAVKKFSPLLVNIEKLKTEAKNENELKIITSVANQLKEDFVLIEDEE